MNTRAFLVRGLLAGLIAGLLAFFVAYQIGEPSIEAAIALEEAGDHSHTEGEAAVSRSTQRTFGLVTGTLTVGIALGGIVGLLAAGALGRLGRMSPAQSTAVVTLIGFVAFALVPFVRYPANPPAVGSGETIGERTGAYFAFLLISVVAAAIATTLAAHYHRRFGGFVVVVGGAAAYLAVVIVAGALLPTIDELGDFPASTLWAFRVAGLVTLATMWAVLGVVLTGLVDALHRRTTAAAERRALAASL